MSEVTDKSPRWIWRTKTGPCASVSTDFDLYATLGNFRGHLLSQIINAGKRIELVGSAGSGDLGSIPSLRVTFCFLPSRITMLTRP